MDTKIFQLMRLGWNHFVNNWRYNYESVLNPYTSIFYSKKNEIDFDPI